MSRFLVIFTKYKKKKKKKMGEIFKIAKMQLNQDLSFTFQKSRKTQKPSNSRQQFYYPCDSAYVQKNDKKQ